MGIARQLKGNFLKMLARHRKLHVPCKSMSSQKKGLAPEKISIVLQSPYNGKENRGMLPPECWISVPQVIQLKILTEELDKFGPLWRNGSPDVFIFYGKHDPDIFWIPP